MEMRNSCVLHIELQKMEAGASTDIHTSFFIAALFIPGPSTTDRRMDKHNVVFTHKYIIQP